VCNNCGCNADPFAFNAEKKNCGCGQDPCITYGAEKTVPLNYTPDIAPYAGVFEKMEVTFKIQDADYATFYYTTEIPSGLRRHSDEHIVSYIWGDECEPQDDNWFYCPYDWNGVGEHYLAKVMNKTLKAESFGAEKVNFVILGSKDIEGVGIVTEGSPYLKNYYGEMDEYNIYDDDAAEEIMSIPVNDPRYPLKKGEMRLIEAMVYGFNHPRINDSRGELNEDGMFWAGMVMETLANYSDSPAESFGAESEIDRYNKHMDEILEVKARLLEENIEDYDPNDPEQEAENDAIYEVFSKYYPDIYGAESLEDLDKSQLIDLIKKLEDRDEYVKDYVEKAAESFDETYRMKGATKSLISDVLRKHGYDDFNELESENLKFLLYGVFIEGMEVGMDSFGAESFEAHGIGSDEKCDYCELPMDYCERLRGVKHSPREGGIGRYKLDCHQCGEMYESCPECDGDICFDCHNDICIFCGCNTLKYAAESFGAEYGKRQRFGNRYVGRDTKGKFISNVSVGRSLKADRRTKSKTPARSGFGHKGDTQKGASGGFKLPTDAKSVIGIGAVLGGLWAYLESQK